MAMTKAEKARVEAIEQELAFRWPMHPEPAPVSRDEIEANLVEVVPRDRSVYKTRRVYLGWWFNAYGRRVEPAWSDGAIHGWGNHTGDGGSKGSGTIYRTKADAAIALRWAMCREFAKALYAVDKIIAEHEEPKG